MIHTYTEEQTGRAVNWRDVLLDLPLAFEALRLGDAAIQARQRIDCGHWKLSGMAAVWDSRAVAAYKTYSSRDGQFNFLLNLFDLATGDHHVMPAGEITRARTAAMTTWAAQQLANPGAPKLAGFRQGVQGRTHVEALHRTLGFTDSAVVDSVDVAAPCAALSEQLGVSVKQVRPQQAVTDADVVVTITRSKTPVFDGNWLKPGATVCAVGTSLPNGSEIDVTTRLRSQQVVVEWKPQSLVEAGEIVLGLADRSLEHARIFDLTEMSASGVPWRQSVDDIVLFKAVGVGLSDLVAARLVATSGVAG